jgi:hypothetical protein
MPPNQTAAKRETEKPHFHMVRENIAAPAKRMKCPLPRAECPAVRVRALHAEASEDRAWHRNIEGGEA